MNEATDTQTPHDRPLAAPSGSAWRDPETDPPRMTGKILVWMHGGGPVVVNVEERSMWTWDGDDDVTPTDPDEWDAWAEISKPNNKADRP